MHLKIKAIIISFVFFSTNPLFSQTKPVADSVTVFIFLSESCPICQSYTLPLKELYKKYKNKKVKFTGVFPNYYVSEKDISDFKKEYGLPFALVKDKQSQLTKQFQATVTPQVFVQGPKQQLIYSGRIDNSFYAIGKRRTVTTSNDLDKALAEYFSGKRVTTPTTQAVGCIINVKE